MAASIGPTEFIVFKFKESGLAALCEEVADLVRTGEADKFDLDIQSAEYRQDETGQHNVVFAYKGRDRG